MNEAQMLAAKLEEHLSHTGWAQVTTDADELYWISSAGPCKWTVTKETKFGSEYERYGVALTGSRWRCPCIAMRMHGRCKHVDLIKAVSKALR